MNFGLYIEHEVLVAVVLDTVIPTLFTRSSIFVEVELYARVSISDMA